jgi:ParB family transcriptional regulator, chromosome partitioning protein
MFIVLSGTIRDGELMMAKKQSDYLADLLADETVNAVQSTEVSKETAAPYPAPLQPSRSGAAMSLLGRESALARVASGEVRQVTQLSLIPARVRVWAGNARFQAALNEDTVRDLIDSIISEGGQKVPVIVRRVEGDPSCDYEVIAGTRRHFAISWLRANSYPDMKLIAQVADLDDEAAFRLADIENRARKDVSDIERARNYAAAIDAHYGGKQRRMAERLKLSEGWLSKMLKVATLPDEILSAFASVEDIQLKPAYPLAQFYNIAGNSTLALQRAYDIREDQAARKLSGKPAIPAADVIRHIMQGRVSAAAPSPAPYETKSSYGRTMLSLVSQNRQGLTLRLHAGSGASRDEIVTELRRLLEQLEADGKGLQS